MNEFLSSHLPAAQSLAGIARELITDTRDAAYSKARDLRAQVDELWEMAGDLVPRPSTEKIVRHVRSAIDVLRARDLILFPIDRRGSESWAALGGLI